MPDYLWICEKCKQANPAYAEVCRDCGFEPLSETATDSNTIIVRSNGLVSILTAFAFFVAASAVALIQLQIGLMLWVPLLVLISIAFMTVLFRRPYEFAFNALSRSLEVKYLVVRNPRRISFDAIAFIQSYVTTVRDNDPCIRLEICLKEGKRIPIKDEAPAWDSTFSIGFSSCREPESLAALRKRIARLAGIKDLGYCGVCHWEL